MSAIAWRDGCEAEVLGGGCWEEGGGRELRGGRKEGAGRKTEGGS